jgi:hypothetical protein
MTQADIEEFRRGFRYLREAEVRITGVKRETGHTAWKHNYIIKGRYLHLNLVGRALVDSDGPCSARFFLWVGARRPGRTLRSTAIMWDGKYPYSSHDRLADWALGILNKERPYE